MGRFVRTRGVIARAHLLLCLRLPTLLAIAAARVFARKHRSSVQSILLVRPDGLGDCILTLPLVQSLRHCFPAARLTVLTTPLAAPLFSALSPAGNVVVLRPALTQGWPKYLRSLLGALRASFHLRAQQFDVAVLPRWDADIFHGTLLCALSRAPLRIGYADATTASKLRICRGFQRAWTTVLPPGPLQHEADRALQTAAPLGCNTASVPPELLLTSSQQDQARAWLHAAHGNPDARVLVGVGLPAAEAKRRLTPAFYGDAFRHMQLHNVAFVLFADMETLDDARLLQQALPGSCIAHNLPLVLAAGVLAQCAAFIGTDSGLGHLAAAAGCSTVTLCAQAANCNDHTGWHSNSPARFRPLSAHGVVLQPARARPGCEHGCWHTGPHCVLDITPEQAAQAVASLLTNSAE